MAVGLPAGRLCDYHDPMRIYTTAPLEDPREAKDSFRHLEEIGYDGWVMGELSTYADTDAAESCYVNRKYLASVGY